MSHCHELHNIVKHSAGGIQTSFSEISSINCCHFRVYEFQPKNEFDIDGLLIRTEEQIQQLVSNLQSEEQSEFKIQLTVCAEMIKEIDDEKNDACFNSLMEPIYRGNDGLAEDVYEKMKNHIVVLVETYTHEGSGWIVNDIKAVRVNFAKMKSMRGGTFIPTPDAFKNNMFLLNIKTKGANQNCLELCLLAAKYRTEIPVAKWEKPESYLPWAGKINMRDLKPPVKVTDLGKLERINGLSINVIGYDPEEFYPLNLVKRQD